MIENITKKEYASIKMMQGLIGNPQAMAGLQQLIKNTHPEINEDELDMLLERQVATLAIRYADALLKEFESD